METKTKKKSKKTEIKNIPGWEIKDRQYYLRGDKNPLSYVLTSKSSPKKPLLWFDEEKGYNREIRYASNQKSCFIDEQDGNAILSHIIFEDGVLYVPKSDQPLQKLLSLYHPKKGYVYEERDDIAEAKELPAPNISRTEYDLKDELIRQTIMDTQEDVDVILEKIDKLDERLYELQKK